MVRVNFYCREYLDTHTFFAIQACEVAGDLVERYSLGHAFDRSDISTFLVKSITKVHPDVRTQSGSLGVLISHLCRTVLQPCFIKWFLDGGYGKNSRPARNDHDSRSRGWNVSIIPGFREGTGLRDQCPG